MAKDSAGATVFEALDELKIEIPSWGFANTGTRFGKFIQPAAATCIEEKFSDAAEVHRKFRSSQKSAVSDLGLSIPTCFKTRNTSTDPLVILIPISGAELWIISSSVLPLPTLLAAATSRLGSPTVRIILALKAFARELRGLKKD